SAVCVSVVRPIWPSVPALLNAMSKRPKVATVLSTSAFTSASRVTSVLTKSAFPPAFSIAWTTACPSFSRRPATTTFAPAFASATAAALPMPEVPPVTTATLFSSDVFILIPFVANFIFSFCPRLHAVDTSCIALFRKSRKSYDALVVIGFCDKLPIMELRHLRYFAAVAQHLNYSEASRRLHVAQPAISQTILDLEDELGVKLLLRNK